MLVIELASLDQMDLVKLRVLRLIVRALSVATSSSYRSYGFGLWRVVVFVPGMSFDMSPVFRLGDWRFTHGTISISTFVETDKIRMNCQVTRATNRWHHLFSNSIRIGLN
jgi:hypothetical protein